MKIIKGKCDACGKESTMFYQVKYRIVVNEKIGDTVQLDLCKSCFKKAQSAVTDQKQVVSHVS